MRSVILLLASVLIYLATASSEAKSEQLGIGSIRMGMLVEDVIEGDTSCTTEGMLVKYIVCNQPLLVRDVPLDAKYYFDIGTRKLVAMNAQFASVYYDQLVALLSHTLDIESPVIESMYQGNKLIKHEMPAGNVVLKYKEHGNFGSIYMISAEGKGKHAREIDKYFEEH